VNRRGFVSQRVFDWLTSEFGSQAVIVFDCNHSVSTCSKHALMRLYSG